MAQVDHERGQQHHGDAGTARQQADGDELRRAGEDQQGHSLRLPGIEPGGTGQAAEDDAEGNGAEQHGQHIAGTLGELVLTGHGTSLGRRA